jgi:hypothetical protein
MESKAPDEPGEGLTADVIHLKGGEIGAISAELSIHQGAPGIIATERRPPVRWEW